MPYEILSLLYTFGIRSEHWLYKQIILIRENILIFRLRFYLCPEE